jgi:hypothetical protein
MRGRGRGLGHSADGKRGKGPEGGLVGYGGGRRGCGRLITKMGVRSGIRGRTSVC